MKLIKFIIWSTVILSIVLCQGYLNAGQEVAGPPYQELVLKAGLKGKVNVIVKFQVADLLRLTANSTIYRTGFANTAITQRAVDADLELQQAIFNAGDMILFNLNGCELIIRHRYSTIPYMALQVSDSALKILISDPEVLDIIEDKPLPLPRFQRENTDAQGSADPPALNQSVDLIGAKDAWQMGFTGQGWYVAVLDTGIRSSHEMFTGKTIVEQCYSLRNNCPNGQSQMSGAGAAANYDSSYDGFSHGTHVSGIATGNNKTNMFGVAKDADILAVQVFSRFSLAECSIYGYSTPCLLSYNSDQVRGLEFVYQQRNNYNIAAVNMSIGGGSYSSYCNSDPAKAAIDNLEAAGIATAIASGNDGYCNAVSSPGCVQSAVTVGASTKNDEEASFSNWQVTIIDLMAPGQYINSSTADTDQRYQSWSGTSMATPHIAGAWAIFKQVVPSFPVNEVLNVLKADGTSITTKCGTGAKKPRINIATSLAKYLIIFPPANFSGEQVANQSLTQTEYVNVLGWESNPYNDQKGQNIVNYRLYLVENNQNTLLQEFDANVFLYWHRNVDNTKRHTYAITSINNEGLESPAAYVEIGD